MPLLTVMMPAKNASTTIRQAIRTTLKAMPRDAEIVVWNDGSADDTGDIAESVGDKRVRVIHSNVSVGGGRARQEIMSRSDSALIASMDADDLCLPWRFSSQSRLLRAADITFGSAIWFGSNLNQFRLKNPVNYSPSDSRISLLFHSPFAHPTLLARRSAIDLVGGYSTIAKAQDYELWLRLAAAEVPIARLGLPTVAYRQSPGQVSGAAGYHDQIRATPQIWRSYRELALSLFRGSDVWDVSSRSDLSGERVAVLFEDLRSKTQEMSPLLRARYRGYVRTRTATLIGR